MSRKSCGALPLQTSKWGQSVLEGSACGREDRDAREAGTVEILERTMTKIETAD